MENYLQKVEEKEAEKSELDRRMDADRDLGNLAPYVMRDKDKKRIPNIINVTLNDPAYFLAYVEARLNASSEQIVVESDNKKIDTHYIEDVLRAAFGGANALLRKQGKWLLNPYFDQQACRRGGAVARCLFRMKDGVLIPDITYWDRRYFSYEMGDDGLDWGAYRTTRQKDLIEKKYALTVSGKTAKVIDIWSKEHNEVWIDRKQVREEPHSYGFVPVALQIVSLGSMLADEDSMKNQGESLFFLIRDIIPELNRLASMAQTANFLATQRPGQWESEEGINAKPPAYEEANAPASMTPVDPGMGVKLVPIQDLLRAFGQMHSIMETRMQRGSLTAFDLGTFTQPMSAVALVEIGEGRNQVFLPRLANRGFLKDSLSEMIIEQLIQIGGTVELGTRGHKRKFQTSKLEGEYEITHKYFIKSPTIDAGRVTLAAAYGDSVSNKFKRKNVYQLEDNEGEERQMRWEEAERLSPAIKMRRVTKALVDMGEEEEANLMLDQLGVSMEQMLAGEAGEKPEPEQEPKQVIPMLGGGRARPPERTEEE